MKNYLFVMNSGKVPEPHGIKMKTARWNSVNMAACLRKYSHFVSLSCNHRANLQRNAGWLCDWPSEMASRRAGSGSGRGQDGGAAENRLRLRSYLLILYLTLSVILRFGFSPVAGLPSWLNEPVHMPTCHPLFLNIIPCFCFYLFFNICHHGCNASVWLATD